MSTYGKQIDHTLMGPQGAVSRNRGWKQTSATAKDKRRASTRSFAATSKLRHKLRNTSVAFVDDSWCHVVAGVVVSKFANVSAAIDAL